MSHLEEPVRRIERMQPLDGPAGAIRDVVQRAMRNRSVSDALHGVWLGHPLHPALAQFALGSFLSASLIDLCGGRQRESSGLIMAGLAASVPTAAAGLADYAAGHEEQQRVGVVHAALNGAAAALYTAALLRRRGGQRGGRLLSVAGAVVSGLSGGLGGHLSYRLASGANHGAEVPHVGPGDWTQLGELATLPVGRPVRRLAGDVPVFVLRREVNDVSDSGLTVMSDRCPHLAAPLHEGELRMVDQDMCITCPWHSSMFRVADGEVVHGPATAPIPGFHTRVRDGIIEVKVRTLPGVPAS
jgi:nitrite reductase/ring-hydroxylating ferredoxin subunit/uncharacterized membrane protein